MFDPIKLLTENEEYNVIRAALSDRVSPVHVTGTSGAGAAHIMYALSQSQNTGALIVLATESAAERMYEDYRFFDKSVVRIPKKELVLRRLDAMGQESVYNKLSALSEVSGANAVVMSVGALMQLVTPKEKMDGFKKTFRVGDTVDIAELSAALTEMGYTRADMVEGVGQFSVRGGIIDIFSPDSPVPYRMELFDDEIDSIRKFDAETQVSTEKVLKMSVMLCADVDETGSVLSYINKNWLVFLDEPQRISQQAEGIYAETEENVKTLLEKGELADIKDKYLNDYNDIVKELLCHKVVSFSALSPKTPDYRVQGLYNMTVKVMRTYGGKLDLLAEDLSYYIKKKSTVVLLAGSTERAKNIVKTLTDENILCSRIKRGEDVNITPGIVYVMRGSLSSGFEYPLTNTVIISDRELFPKERARRRKRIEGTEKIRDYSQLSPGDYVVHEVHGIGRFVGMERIQVDGVTKDYLKLLYKGEDNLYVPVNQLDILHKYKSGALIETDSVRVKLNRLGGTDWRRTKSNVKKNAQELAAHLVELYAAREKEQGIAFSRDDMWQREFESEFMYEETADQLCAIEETKADMQKPRPMDRLLCGDVGFGKTEVAMRAAFKCVNDGYQVAYLVPTTILAKQQYANFCQRMKNYPVTVEMLSRFRTKAQQDKIIQKVKSGEVDIIIGTHRLLSDDVNFKKLGLLVIDEEQRFGVAHKEKIKQIKKNVDVLTLSATPIPRSLHMSMLGIRDMSVLANPPENRQPVQTFVMEYNFSVVAEAIDKELSRGGQVYYLFNRVTGINRVAEKIRQAFPDARVEVAHGKMNQTQLEDIMMRMVDGEADVLVCTTIIETGLDIPNVNTIIIENADRMGLSQLYQLRGRVGRSGRLAYSYMTYQRDKVLSEEAEKRLLAIKEFTQFGSGFRIAMRDLELRGAGNLLGPEQSGHLEAVGYDVYCKILDEAVREAKGEPPCEVENATVDISVSAFIPGDYIQNTDMRISVYKKIAGIESLADSYRVEEELEDRFGDPPDSVRALIKVALIRADAKECGITEITQSGENVTFYLSQKRKPALDKISDMIGASRGKILFGAGERAYITVRKAGKSENELLENVKKVLQCLKKDE